MFKHVIAGRNGTLYAINHQGDLLWFRYLGFQDGSIQWDAYRQRPDRQRLGRVSARDGEQ